MPAKWGGGDYCAEKVKCTNRLKLIGMDLPNVADPAEFPPCSGFWPSDSPWCHWPPHPLLWSCRSESSQRFAKRRFL